MLRVAYIRSRESGTNRDGIHRVTRDRVLFACVEGQNARVQLEWLFHRVAQELHEVG